MSAINYVSVGEFGFSKARLIPAGRTFNAARGFLNYSGETEHLRFRGNLIAKYDYMRDVKAVIFSRLRKTCGEIKLYQTSRLNDPDCLGNSPYRGYRVQTGAAKAMSSVWVGATA